MTTQTNPLKNPEVLKRLAEVKARREAEEEAQKNAAASIKTKVSHALKPTVVVTALRAIEDFDTVLMGNFLSFKQGQRIAEDYLITHCLQSKCPVVIEAADAQWVKCPECGCQFSV